MTFESLKNKFFDIDLAHNYFGELRVLIKPQDIFLVATEEGDLFVVKDKGYKRWKIGIGCPHDVQYEIIRNALSAGHIEVGC